MSCYLAAGNWLVDERDKLHHVQVLTLRDGKCGGLLLVRLRRCQRRQHGPGTQLWQCGHKEPTRYGPLASPQVLHNLLFSQWPQRRALRLARPAEADLNLDLAVRLVDEHTRRDGSGCYSRKKGQQLREE